MRKQLLLISTLFILQKLNAQLAFIKDPDGFCNVRDKASNQSKIQDTLANNRFVFHLPEEEGDAKANWLLVDYKKNDKTLSGYVHRSRIVFVNSLEKFKPVALKDSMLTLQLRDMTIVMKSGKFAGAGRHITYEKPKDESKFVKLIDGKEPWGTDGNIPRGEYKLIQVKYGTHTLTFPKTSFNDLFEPTFDNTAAYFDKAGNAIYISASNGDGAGSYELVWALTNQQITHREIFIGF